MASFGEELRRERELRDISLKEIAEATKISIKFLEALEQNHFDLLPGGIFNRGFIRAYARFIGVDGEEMVNAYLHEVSQRQPQQGHSDRTQTAATSALSEAPTAGLAEATSRPEPRHPERRDAPKGPRQDIRLERRLTPRARAGAAEGRTSMALWVLVVLAFLVGAAVLTVSLVDQAATGPSAVKADSRPTTQAPPQPTPPLAASVATPAGAPDEAASSPQTGTEPAQDAAAGSQDPNSQPTAPVEPVIPEHRIKIVATETTRVRIECADKVYMDQELWPGQTKTFTCPEPALLSADNAGAVQYSIDDSPARLLGGVGEKIEGLVVAPTAPPPAPPPAPRRPAPAAPQVSHTDAGD